MAQPARYSERNYLLLVAPVLLIAGFFIPWVSWDDFKISGADMPLGNFFSISATNFYLANPFPQFDFAYYLLWLIPILAAVTIIISFLKRESSVAAILAGILALIAAAIYILFSNKLGELGTKHSLMPGIYISILAAILIIVSVSIKWIWKAIFIIAAPLCVWIGFNVISKQLMNEKFDDTANTKADYTVNAMEMIKEFQTSDSLANAKYLEKIIVVNGSISAIEKPNDSTINVKFIDSTTGSYLIFPFEGEKVKEAAKLKAEESVSLKGSCSGAVYSQILGAWFISFKRSVIHKD